MDSKKFLIFRIIVVVITCALLISITYYQNNELKEEEKVIEEDKKNNISEDVLIDACKIYISNNQDYYSDLLKENIEIRVNTDDLVSSKLIDNNDDYKGYIKFINDEFKYVKIEDMLLDKIDKTNYIDGIGEEKEAYDLKYIYVGNDPDNYIKYEDKLYRIIGITYNNDLKVIETENSIEETWGLSGDINYLKIDEEKANENENDNENENENIFMYYVGFVRSNTSEILQIMKNEKRNNNYTKSSPKYFGPYSYANVSDVINASNMCEYSKITDINKNNCDSYLLDMLNNTYLSNSSENNKVYKVNEKGNIIITKIENNINVKRVTYISLLNEYKSGNGFKESPYEIK